MISGLPNHKATTTASGLGAVLAITHGAQHVVLGELGPLHPAPLRAQCSAV